VLVDDAFHHNGRSEPLHTGQRGELLVPKPLIGSDVSGSDPDEVVGVSEEPFCMTHLRDCRQAALEFCDRCCVLAIHRHGHQDLEAETDSGGIDDGPIPADDTGPFQLAQPSVARRHAESDPLCQLGHGKPPLRLEKSKNLSINRIHSKYPSQIAAA